MIARIKSSFAFVLIALAACAQPASAAEPKSNLAFVADGNGFHFDTGIFRGNLHKGGKSVGLGDVVDVKTGATISASMGLFSHYRLLDSTARYGGGAWDWKSDASLLPDGAVEAQWLADNDHPFDLKAVYRWHAPDTLDVITIATARKNLRHFESFLASYFAGFDQSYVYAQRPGRPGAFILAAKGNGDWQAFPRDEEAATIVQDGRWKRPPNPVDWVIMPELAGALALRRDAKTGLAALVMAPPEDCFALLTPYSGEGHRSLYLSLFGKDLKAGQMLTARSRLVIGRDMSDQKAIELYREYLRAAAR